MELPVTDSFNRNELKIKLNNVMEFAIGCATDVGLSGVRQKMRAAVFYYKDLYQKYGAGWHFQMAKQGSGEHGHYDHGVGVARNEDLRYSFVVPYFSEALGYLYSNAIREDLDLGGVFLFSDGAQVYGRLTSTCTRYSKEDGRTNKVTYFFNRKIVDLSFLRTIEAQVPLPTGKSGIWERDESKLVVGQKIFYHDGVNARFGVVQAPGDNKRYQRYSGKLISGLPLPSVSVGWCSETDMLDFLQLTNALRISKQK